MTAKRPVLSQLLLQLAQWHAQHPLLTLSVCPPDNTDVVLLCPRVAPLRIVKWQLAIAGGNGDRRGRLRLMLLLLASRLRPKQLLDGAGAGVAR